MSLSLQLERAKQPLAEAMTACGLGALAIALEGTDGTATTSGIERFGLKFSFLLVCMLVYLLTLTYSDIANLSSAVELSQ